MSKHWIAIHKELERSLKMKINRNLIYSLHRKGLTEDQIKTVVVDWFEKH